MRELLLAAALGLAGAAAANADGPGPNLVLTVGGSTEGEVVIDLLPEVAPRHVARITELAEAGRYDRTAFFAVIPGFMATAGDVEFGKHGELKWARIGSGGSDLPKLPAEFSTLSFDRGTVGMMRDVRSSDSARSAFFIVTGQAPSLNGKYTLFGRVISGMEVVDALKAGRPEQRGSVREPDYIVTARIER